MFSFLLIIVVAVVAAVVFTLWVVVAGTRSLWRLVAGQVNERPQVATTAGPRCPNSGCGTINPAQARFCRRCGSAMGTAVQMSGPMSGPIRSDRSQPMATSAVR